MIAEQKGTRATVLEASIGETKSGGEQVVLVFGLEEGPNMGNPITAYRSLSECAAPYTAKDMTTLGWMPGEDVSKVLGAVCRLTIVHEEYDGKVSAKVKWINPVNFSKPAAPDKVSGAMARLAAAAKANAALAPLPPEPPPHTDADLPF
ncbi:MAG: hypothetical protein FJ298_14260 [Planctomycetes bacterium]|nr:hypothetical protein [Planctomycetota bacterium]